MCVVSMGKAVAGALGQPASFLSSSPAPLAAPGSSRGPLDVTNQPKLRLWDEASDLVSIKSADCFMAGWKSCEAPGLAPLAAGSCLSIAVSLDGSSQPTPLNRLPGEMVQVPRPAEPRRHLDNALDNEL